MKRTNLSKHKKEIGVDIQNNKNLDTNVDECIITNASVPTITVLSEVPFSMISRWSPNISKSFQDPSSVTSMIAHCAVKEKLVSKSEFLQLWTEFLEQIRKDRAEILAEIIKCKMRSLVLTRNYDLIIITTKRFIDRLFIQICKYIPPVWGKLRKNPFFT